ncbi:hypothetical protein A2U01_0049165, partial [Trifolium medium]|nr:hypothetical protein [Trifolium medium]
MLKFCWYFKAPEPIHVTIDISMSVLVKKPVISTRTSIATLL